MSIPQSKPQIRLNQPPARPHVLTGPSAAALFRTADQLAAKGKPAYARLTAPLKGEMFLLTLHAARHAATGETWTLATYHSRTFPGRARRLILDPGGDLWMLCPADDRSPARCIRSLTKYYSHLWQIAEEARTQKGR